MRANSERGRPGTAMSGSPTSTRPWPELGETGGGVYRAAEAIPDVGRFAVVHDPQGAPFTLFTPLPRRTA